MSILTDFGIRPVGAKCGECSLYCIKTESAMTSSRVVDLEIAFFTINILFQSFVTSKAAVG